MTIKDVILKEIKGIWGNPPVEGELSTPVIKTNNMTYEGYIDYDDITYRSIPDNKITSCFLKRGDLLVEKSGGTKTHSVGYVNIFNKENDVFVCNNFIVGLRPDNTIILSEYLFFQMKYFYEIGIFSDCYNKTTGIQNLQLQTYLSKPIVCPEKAEQKKVVSTLSNIVKALDKKKEQLKKLDELIQSKFYEMFGDPVVNDKGWKMKNLGEISKVKIGPFGSLLHNHDYIKGGIPLVNPIHMSNEKICPDYNFSVSNEKIKELQNYILQTDDILLARRGDIGRCALVGKEENGFLCGTGSLFVRPIKSVNSIFIVKLIRCNSMIKYLTSFAKGVTMLNINCKIVEQLPIILPPLPLQQAFAAYVEKVEQAKAIVNQEIAHLQELLDSRMDYYFRK